MSKRQYKPGPVHRAALKTFKKMPCEICGVMGTSGNPMTVDHIVARVDAPSWAENRANFRPLCRKCNSGLGGVVAARRVRSRGRRKRKRRITVETHDTW